MTGRNFSLTPHLSQFIDPEGASGRHHNAGEVVREALRRYEDDVLVDRANLAAIESLAEESLAAIERGEFTLVSGPVGARALLDSLNDRTAFDATAGGMRRG